MRGEARQCVHGQRSLAESGGARVGIELEIRVELEGDGRTATGLALLGNVGRGGLHFRGGLRIELAPSVIPAYPSGAGYRSPGVRAG